MIDRRVGSQGDILLGKADEFALLVYKITRKFPKDELFGLTSQLRRAVLSIPLNMVEGFARNSRQEHRRFLDISLGSLKETKYIISFAYQQDYLLDKEKEELLDRADELSKMLWKKIQTLKNGKA